MSVTVRPFGSISTGEEVKAYTITNDIGASCTLLDYGATIQAVCVPNKDGGLTDVVLGYDTAAGYETGRGHLGGMIGRVGNRIGGARFSLNGKEYPLEKNNGEACLHSGFKSYDHYMWNAEIPGEYAVRFTRLSPDGEQGFPGNLEVSVTYTLTKEGADLRIDYDAVSDADTLFAPTNHSYFDLSGCGRAMEQTLWLNAPRYLEIKAGTIPTGLAAIVAGTPFDFTLAKPIGQDINEDNEQLRLANGYDHNFCIIDPHAATLESAETGIRMETYTSMPGVQFYSGNGLGEQVGKGGVLTHNRSAVCLETQLWPDGLNHWGFPSPILRKGEPAHSVTIYSFSVIK
ncbi:MAG: galactose mutarotase [Oscillospiraceae bacterium]|nr:galactose mutarotase [Oscillospiraceae bacterium]